MTNPFVDDKNFSSQASSGKVSSARTTKGIANDAISEEEGRDSKAAANLEKNLDVYKGYINRRNSIIS